MVRQAARPMTEPRAGRALKRRRLFALGGSSLDGSVLP